MRDVITQLADARDRYQWFLKQFTDVHPSEYERVYDELVDTFGLNRYIKRAYEQVKGHQ
jgi:hypothetical protein